MMFTYQMVIRILVETLGFVILDEAQDDFAINDYVVDSISFIQFIIAVEEEIGTELPDDFINHDILSSAKGFAEKLDAFIDDFSGNTCCAHE